MNKQAARVLSTLAGAGVLLVACGASRSPSASPAKSPENSSPQSALEITYLANEGFLLSGGERCILIDGLFQEGVTGYQRIPPEALAKIRSAQPPFECVRLGLATHAHRDHFDPRIAGQHLYNNPRAFFVGTWEAVDMIAEKFAAFAEVRSRVRSAAPGAGQRLRVNVGGVDLEVLGLQHQGSPQHVGYLFYVGGKKILHMGDCDLGAVGLEALGLEREAIDIAFIPYWLLINDAAAGLVRDHVNPRVIVAMHIPRADAEDSELRKELEKLGGPAGISRKVRAAFPNARVANTPMEKIQP